MKTIIVLALSVLVGFGVSDKINNIQTEQAVQEATAMIESYDKNKDGVLDKQEQLDFVKDTYEKQDSFTKEELDTAVIGAQGILGQFDTNGDGSFDYDEQIGLVRKVYEKYDAGEIKDETFKDFLEGYSNHVDDLNSYTAILDEVGVPGKSYYIDIRG